MASSKNLRKLVLASIFIALIVVMTSINYVGYINYGGVEITTLHIPVIVAGIFLGWQYGALIGGVWGITCIIRALSLGFLPFANPLVSLIPRIIVGLVAGMVFMLCRKKLNGIVSSAISAAAATLTNTVLVLSALQITGDLQTLFGDGAKLISSIITTIIAINFVIELCAAVIIVPAVYAALSKTKAGRELSLG